MSEIRLYATPPHECSYLKDKIATTVFVDPDADLDADSYRRLSEYGFRRSGNHFYRPNCDDCNACVSVRVPVFQFSPNRSQRRCIKRNQDLQVRVLHQLSLERHYGLYQRYIEQRHQDGDMYPPSRAQFVSFLAAAHPSTRFYEFCDDSDRVLAVAVADELEDHISAVYTFYDPDEQARSLGTFCVLFQIQRCQQLLMRSLYLGYWVEDCRKMSYKTDYQPLEFLNQTGWQRQKP
ncbi:MAG: arginyltransferase [Cellvibrionaceae bacterium]|nr:arginyltransferase [Cellvibrionaceae bacterium]MCV6628107.1 arginyltransferase [Cellvibrionaceae bacterium]